LHTILHRTDLIIFPLALQTITITTAYLIRIKYPLSGFNYHLSDVNIANFSKIHHTVFEQHVFTKWDSKTEVSNMENTD